MENCDSRSLATILLCGIKQTDEECWEFKKDFFIDNDVFRGSCCYDGLCCEEYATGYLYDRESIKFKDVRYRCYFE